MSVKPIVYATRPMSEPVIQFLSPHCEVRAFTRDEPLSPDELAAICRDQPIEALLSTGARISRSVIEAGRRLRVISHLGKGTDSIDIPACTERGIIVTNVTNAPEESTADVTFALMLAAARRVVEGDRYIREGHWQGWKWRLLWGFDVYGKTIGLYGFGTIGQAVARRAAGFSMRTLYYARHRVAESLERELKALYVEPETLIRDSDFVSLHVPLTSETRHLITARELAWMKPTAFLINTARGPVVDEAALVDALQSGRIAGAGLDVFEHEPKVHPALLKMPSVVLMPHLGSATEETRTRMGMLAAENLVAALNGRRPPNIVNPEVLDGRRP